MGKISQYTRALKAKLSDLFVVASSDNGSLSTKAVTTEQIGDAIITEQTFSGLDGKTPAEAMADNTDSIGDLTALTTSVQSSLVGAVNEVNGQMSFQTAKSVKFQVASGRLLIYLYTDNAQANGMRIDFDSSANVIELSSITNGTTTPTNRISFPHV